MTRFQYVAELAQDAERLRQAKILVVEDEPNLLSGLCSVLQLDHYQLLTAENGVEAFEVLRSQSQLPDLILSDIMMPQMDGIQLLTQVRANRRWVSIPFIFLTALNENAQVQRGKELGVEDYIVKPYDPEALRSIVRGRLRRSWMLNDHFSSAMQDQKTKILTILNHEFRTPLTFVVAYADMLTTGDVTPEELPVFVSGMASGALRLRRLVENFILLVDLELDNALATYQSRKQTIYDVRNLLESARAEVFNQPKVNHTCEIYIGENLQPFVGDEAYLMQALKQLLDNAVKFSEATQPIRVGAHMHSETEIALWVEDRGRGIPNDELQDILQSFYQINREHYEDQGAGAGLAIVKGITHLHGGRIGIETAPGEGSTFFILLPSHNLQA